MSPLSRPLGILAAGLTIAGASLGLVAAPASAGAAIPASPGSGLTPGSYTGPGPQGGDGYYDLTFYVSSSGTKIQNISFPSITVTCAPGGAKLSFPIAIDSANLNANGSFSVSQSQKGDYAGYPATFKIAMSGQASGTGAGGQPTMAGTLSETVSYSNGIKYSCPTGTLSWSATRDASQTLTTGAPPIGSYTGAGPQGGDGYYDFTYDVSSTQTELQNVAFPAITLTCSPGDATPAFPVVLDSVPLASDGSFTTSQTQTGDYDGFPATFKIAFAGNFHGLNASGAARAAGDLTETMTYTAGGTNYSCTSNNLAIAAAYDASQTVTTGKPPTGSYTGADPQGGDGYYNCTFYVSDNDKHLQNIAFPAITVTCAPGASTPLVPDRHRFGQGQEGCLRDERDLERGLQRQPRHLRRHLRRELPRAELRGCRPDQRLAHRHHELQGGRGHLQLHLQQAGHLRHLRRQPDGDEPAAAGRDLHRGRPARR